MRWLVLLGMLALAGCDRPFADAENMVRDQLRDPASAEFRKVSKCDRGNGVMGEVNSANEYGGKTGFEPFIVIGPEVAIGASEDMLALQGRCFSQAVLDESNASMVNLLAD